MYNTQEWLANVRLRHENIGLAAALQASKEREAKLRATIRYLLLSADCSWEENNEGHDWAQACQMAREVLKGEG